MLLAVASCAPVANPHSGDAVTQESHTRYFPITDGTNHALSSTITCDSCHKSPDTFAAFECVSCHQHDSQPVMDRLHESQPTYTFGSAGCYACHPDGTHRDFDHHDRTGALFTDGCPACHDRGNLFPPAPNPEPMDVTHQQPGDCGACHDTFVWKNASTAPTAHDPNQDVTVNALIPTYSATVITRLDPQTEQLHMVMKHDTPQIPDGGMSACSNCHATSSSYPGVFHASLDALNLPQPTACSDCHGTAAMPTGFVGTPPAAMNIVRSPPSGEMKHDAVAVDGGALVSDDCGVCHLAPSDPIIVWSTSATYHAALTAAGKPQPGVCLDCHANTRRVTPISASARYGTVSLDHQLPALLGECATCHTKTSGDWSGGKYHATNPAPGTCVACHEGERPTAVMPMGWVGPYPSPFDYGTTVYGTGQNITHGDGLDCVSCHTKTTGDWSGGKFHSKNPVPGTCIACHSSQRPQTAINGFDHTVDGPGDCFGCHQQTVKTGSYVNYPADWDGGVRYPGDTLISSSDQFITVTEIALNRADGGFVTGMSQTGATLYNAMQHRAAAVLDAGIDPGPSGVPNRDTCWICHTWVPASDGGHTVTTFANGQFHGAIADAGHPQPTSGCDDCHLVMVPANIVERDGGIDVQPMDHAAALLNGTATKVLDLDCSTCHANPGGSWNDGNFHKNLKNKAGQEPAECVSCHYPLMADGVRADVTTGTSFTMKHRSGQVTVQACDTCHDRATMLSKALTGIAANLWSPGAFHARVPAQPGACVDCHNISEPSVTTQSTWSYTLPMGATATNQGQWLSHAAPVVAGKDCALCHAGDATAQTTVSTPWSRSDKLHIPSVTATTCQRCHGLQNGLGADGGINNNLPLGVTSSSTVTSADSTTGVSGLFDQLTHDDANVVGRECNFCHTQAGIISSGAGAGKEWALAKFHVNFTGATSLAAGTRCSNCHWNLKPTAAFTQFDHSGLTQTGGQDCSACHAWPGTGTASAPNWLGATGAPSIVTLDPWTSGTSITSKTVQFAHPPANTYTSCGQCHASVANYKQVVDFNHAGLTTSVTINGVAASPNMGTSKYDAAANPTFCVHCHNNNSPYVVRGASSSLVGDTTSGSTTVNTASTAALVVGMTITGTPIPSAKVTTTNFVGSITAGSTTVTTTTPVTLSSGTVITGNAGIPAGDSVATSVTNATSFTLRTAATQTASGVTLTGTKSTPVTVTIKTITSGTAFTISTAASATATGAALTVTHPRLSQAAIGNHNNSTNGQDCTSCHYTGGPDRLTPPTMGQFGTGSISGN